MVAETMRAFSLSAAGQPVDFYDFGFNGFPFSSKWKFEGPPTISMLFIFRASQWPNRPFGTDQTMLSCTGELTQHARLPGLLFPLES